MKALPIFSLITVVVSSLLSSCDDYDPLEDCTCTHGSIIGGWENADTTSVNSKDTTGSFEINLEQWGDRYIKDIML